MELNNLKPASGSTKVKKRLGRGEGSKTGGTAGRGHKGAQSRSGYKAKKGFEGGQMPLQRRLPKVGFKNFSRVEFEKLNLSKIECFCPRYQRNCKTENRSFGRYSYYCKIVKLNVNGL